ncbi:MAG: CorA family divalent cation transporter [Nanoarchaeota archaeon]|nr:hypothetical protein [Nanoarchaeota archaeon]MBU1030390.1 hypothetical protein [Nanoarchaeota archaeon]
MEIYTYNGKDIERVENLDQVNNKKLTWIRVINESEEKLQLISEKLEIPLDEFKEFLEEEERPRLEQGRFLELVYQAPFRENDEITTIPVNIFLIKQIFVTVEKEPLNVFQKTASLVNKNKLKFLFKKGQGGMLSYFLDNINDEFLSSIDKIANLTDVLESKGLNISDKQLSNLYDSNVTLTHFNQAVLANIEVLNGLRKSYFKNFTKADLSSFTELYYDALQVRDTEKVQREVISNLFNFQSVAASHRLNKFMKKLTSLALIIMIPTLITGIYGMNINLPLQQSPLAFIYLMIIMFLIVVIGLIIFNKIDWL